MQDENLESCLAGLDEKLMDRAQDPMILHRTMHNDQGEIVGPDYFTNHPPPSTPTI
jgi:hypothetical protein